MVTAFFNRGGGAGRGINYLIEDREPQAKILRGDIEQTIQLIDSLDFKQRYLSGVHRFTESDLSEKTKAEIINSFENTIFAGMKEEQRPPVLWVQHQEKGGTELHFIIPEVEMTTGKKFSPYFHKTDLELVDSWKSLVNLDYKLTDPNEPERRQSLTIPKNLPDTKKEAVQKIDEEITKMVQSGIIQNRDQVVGTLENAGFQVTKKTKNFISIQADDWKQPARLKGDWYGEQFKSLDEFREEIRGASQEFRGNTEQRHQLARERLQRAIEKRTRKHEEKYNIAEKGLRGPNKELKTLTNTLKVLEYEHDSNHKLGLGGNSSDGMRDLLGKNENNGSLERHKSSPEDTEKPTQRGEILDRPRWKLSDFREKAGELHVNIRELGNQIRELVRGKHDGVRAKIDGWLDGFERTAQSGNEQFKQANTGLERESRVLEQVQQRTNEVLQQSSRTLERGVERVKENRVDELRVFKTEINLAQYASKLGYKLLRDESSRNSYSMKNDAGDKIVVATDKDGHGIYFSVQNDGDNGSIIDFHQKRTRDNLGQTRKVLRQEIGILRSTEIQTIKTKPCVADHNITGVIKSFSTMTNAENHKYLVEERKISKKILSDKRFKSLIRMDRQGNAVFPHYDKNGLSGYELKNTDFTGFSRGGKKSLWRTANLHTSKQVIITESCIDALSHAALNPRRDAAYVSIGGSMSQEQKTLLGDVLNNAKDNGQKVTIALDNDLAGKDMAQEIKTMLPMAELEIPLEKDWNQQLQILREKDMNQELKMSRRGPGLGM